MIEVKVVKDSVYNGNRLTTLELEYPRYIHSEFMTHRVFSRNAQSNRAIPVLKQIERVEESTWFPIFMENQAGMTASTPLTGSKLKNAQNKWSMAKLDAIHHALRMAEIGVHKQIVNRIIEPYSTIKVIVSATEWDNFFSLRIHPAAQQEIFELATAMSKVLYSSTPKMVDVGNWHLPYIREDEEVLPIDIQKKISAARCARVSYLTHDGQRDIEKDLALFDQLAKERHMSPFEHVATPDTNERTSNFIGWKQSRWYLEREIQ